MGLRSMARRATRRRKRRRARLLGDIPDLWLKELELAGCRKARRLGTGALELEKSGKCRLLVDWDIVEMKWVVMTSSRGWSVPSITRYTTKEHYSTLAQAERHVREWLNEPGYDGTIRR